MSRSNELPWDMDIPGLQEAADNSQETPLRGERARVQDESGISLDGASLLSVIRLFDRELKEALAAGEHTPSRQLFDSLSTVIKGLLNDPKYQDNDMVILASARILNAIDRRGVELPTILSCIASSLGMIEMALTTENGAPKESGGASLSEVLDIESL